MQNRDRRKTHVWFIIWRNTLFFWLLMLHMYGMPLTKARLRRHAIERWGFILDEISALSGFTLSDDKGCRGKLKTIITTTALCILIIWLLKIRLEFFSGFIWAKWLYIIRWQSCKINTQYRITGFPHLWFLKLHLLAGCILRKWNHI